MPNHLLLSHRCIENQGSFHFKFYLMTISKSLLRTYTGYVYLASVLVIVSNGNFYEKAGSFAK